MRVKKTFPAKMSFTNRVAPDPGSNLISELKKIAPNIILVIFRSKNKNVVVYEAVRKNGNVEVEVYWLDIDPEYRKSRRAQNQPFDRVEMTSVELSQAYGATTTPIHANECHFRFNADNTHLLRVEMGESGSKLLILHQDRIFRMRSINVVASEHFNIVQPSAFISQLRFNAIDEKSKKPYFFDRQRDGKFELVEAR